MSAIAPARACAFDVLRRVFEQGAYADRAFAGRAGALDPRDRALAMQLSYGAVQRRATLDHVTEQLTGRPAAKLDPPVVAALRLGLFQLLYLDGVADYAAVGESVELAKQARSGPGYKLVNAVLRRATREGRALVDALDDATPEAAAVKHSVPVWLAELWFGELGVDHARSLLARINEPPESALRANTLVTTADEVALMLPVGCKPAGEQLPEGLVLDGPFDAAGSELWAAGAIFPQSRASMTVARMVAPAPGSSVLDLCAAPGGKTTHLAALVGAAGSVVAVERHEGRAEALHETCVRMRASNVTVETGDASARRDPEGAFDAVLADPPCSGLGTLQSRPDLRWRASPAKIEELAVLQTEILRAAAASTRPGGALVYSVCTISRAETDDVIDAFLAGASEFSEERRTRMFPDRDGTDGFFISRLVRTTNRQH